MYYYEVRGHKVLGWQKNPWRAGTFDIVDEPFMASMSAHEQIILNVLKPDGKSRPEFLERERLRRAYLEQQYDTLGKDEFIRKWVEFDFRQEEAAGFACLVIDTYFRINKNGFLSHEPSFQRGGKEHYNNIDFEPWSDKFYVNLEFEPRRKEKWWHSKPQPNILAFQINLLSVRALHGSLEAFVLITDTHKIRFSWHIVFEDLPSEE